MGTALIVEDHPEQADLVARILRLRDYEPILAEDGESGLAAGPGAPPRRDAPGPDAAGHQRLRRLPPPPDRPGDPADPRRHAHGPQRRPAPRPRVPRRRQRLRHQALRRGGPLRGDRRRPRLARQHGAARLQGEIHVELNSEITLLKDLNDFLMLVCQSTPLQQEQVMQLRQAVMEMAHNAIEWGNLHQSRSPGEHHLPHLRRPPGDRGARPGPGIRPEPAAARRGRPTIRSRTWTSARSWGSAPAASGS